MDVLIQAGQLILSLSILIVLHEFGHYIPARIFNTRVEKFYLFFDWKFSLFKKKIKDTEWGIGWIPLGGYVKISGMIDESMDTEQMAQEPQPYEFRSKPAWQRLIIMIGGIVVNLIVGFILYAMVLFTWGEDIVKYDNIPNGFAVGEELEKVGFVDGDRILSVDGEVLENQLEINRLLMLRSVEKVEVQHQDGTTEVLAIPEDIEYSMFKADESITPRMILEVDSVFDGSSAAYAGLMKGDRVYEVNGEPVQFMDEFAEIVKEKFDTKIEVTVNKDGEQSSKAFTVDSIVSGLAAEALGIHLVEQLVSINGKSIQTWDAFHDEIAALTALDIKIKRSGDTLTQNIVPSHRGKIGVLFGARHSEDIYTHLDYGFGAAIPGGISKAYWTLHDYAAQLKFVFTKKGASSMGGFGAFGKMFKKEWHWQSFWANTALISIILAFMNFLPIPALDGGHIMFLLYEMVTGRQPNQKVLEYAQVAGFFFILALVLYANGNDIYKWLSGQ